MALEEKIEAVKKIDQALRKQPAAVETEMAVERVPPNKEHFQTLMNAEQQAGQAQKIEAVDQSKSSSMIDDVKKLQTKVDRMSELTPEDLKNQARDVIAQLEDVKTQLAVAHPDGEIKASYRNLLRNRLTHIDDSLRIALSKAGVEYTPPVDAAAGSKTLNPIERFLGLLTQGQYQLDHLSQTIEQLNLTNAELTPANMLAIQIKVGQVQQEIELFTSLLNKALESTKTIMNVQV